jgi:hypothetical protein
MVVHDSGNYQNTRLLRMVNRQEIAHGRKQLPGDMYGRI